MSTPSMRLPSPRQRGMALVIALLFLLMLTLIGVASFSTNTAEERMAYAHADYIRAFQAADSAVNQGESWLKSQTSAPVIGGLVLGADPGLSNLYSAKWWKDNGVDFTTTPNQDGSTAGTRTDVDMGRIDLTKYPPRYILQYVDKGQGSLGIGGAPPPPTSWYFRVTGNGTGVSDAITAVTQSVYAKEF